MCRRHNLRVSLTEIQEFFDMFRDLEHGWQLRYNTAPPGRLPRSDSRKPIAS